jgi:cytochrome P450/ketosteroid isomerase-like protein
MDSISNGPRLDDFAVERLATPEVIADPYPYYAALRPRSPVYGYVDWPPGTVPGQDPPVRAWALFGYEEVAAAARDSETFSSAEFQGASSAPTLVLVNQDEPEHGPLRKLVSKAFTPRRVRELRPVMRAIADALIARLPDGEDFDVVEALASELPTRVMMALLGLPDDVCARLKRWSNAFMLSADLDPGERMRSNAEMVEYFRAFVAERAARRARGERGGDDLVEALLDAELDGRRLDESEIWRFCFTLVVAGSETTTYFAANAVDALLRRPELFARLRRERELLPRLLDEVLRLSGPAQRLFRVATRDVQVGHARIRRGDWVALFYAAANHDPREFPEPAQLRLDRPNAGRHLTFGQGVHYCLGGPLALLEVEVLLDALLDHFETLSPGAAPRVAQTATLLQHSAVRLPARGARSALGVEERNLATVREVFARFGAGDVDGILALLDPEVRIEFYGPSVVPYAGFYRGHAEARRFFETVLSRVEIARFEPQEFLARGDKVVVTGALQLFARPSGREIASDFVHVITLRDGRWLRFRDFMNTAVAQSAFAAA